MSSRVGRRSLRWRPALVAWWSVTGDARLTVWVEGRVQGVGFRYWTRHQAIRLGLTGSATNLADGRVEIVAEGPRTACQALLERLEGPATPGSVTSVRYRWDPLQGRSETFWVR